MSYLCRITATHCPFVELPMVHWYGHTDRNSEFNCVYRLGIFGQPLGTGNKSSKRSRTTDRPRHSHENRNRFSRDNELMKTDYRNSAIYECNNISGRKSLSFSQIDIKRIGRVCLSAIAITMCCSTTEIFSLTACLSTTVSYANEAFASKFACPIDRTRVFFGTSRRWRLRLRRRSCA